MRNLAIATVMTLGLSFTATQVRAQSLEVGIKGGVNAAMLPGVLDAQPIANFSAGIRGSSVGGAFAAFQLADRLWLQPEMLLTAKGATLRGMFDANGERYVARLQYLEVPMLLRVETPWRAVFATVGPTLAFSLGANYQTNDHGRVSRQNIDRMVRPRDVALAFGGGTRRGRTSIEARWTEGLSNVGVAGLFAKPLKTRTVSVMAGVTF